jgi:hypothetical protein
MAQGINIFNVDEQLDMILIWLNVFTVDTANKHVQLMQLSKDQIMNTLH